VNHGLINFFTVYTLLQCVYYPYESIVPIPGQTEKGGRLGMSILTYPHSHVCGELGTKLGYE